MTSEQIKLDEDLSQSARWGILAEQAQSGDKKAYRLLLNDIMPYVRARVSGSLANEDWIEDVIQDVLISVHKSLKTYSPDRPFKPWLSSIIQFRKTDFLRAYYKSKKTKEDVYANTETFEQHVTNTHHSGELKDIETALSSLPDKQRKVFYMMKVEGYSAREVASEMNMTVSAVKVSVHRSANKLKGLLE